MYFLHQVPVDDSKDLEIRLVSLCLLIDLSLKLHAVSLLLIRTFKKCLKTGFSANQLLQVPD